MKLVFEGFLNRESPDGYTVQVTTEEDDGSGMGYRLIGAKNWIGANNPRVFRHECDERDLKELRQMLDKIEMVSSLEIPMDPGSNWDICPVCIAFIGGEVGNAVTFPGVEAMRAHHEAHKALGRKVAK